VIVIVVFAILGALVGFSAAHHGRHHLAVPPTALSAVSAGPGPTQVVTFKPNVIARFSGSGIQRTAPFTIGGSGNWALQWSYNCARLGGHGRFILSEDNGTDFNGANVRRVGLRGHGVYQVYGDSGSHRLSVNSRCLWAAWVVSAP